MQSSGCAWCNQRSISKRLSRKANNARQLQTSIGARWSLCLHTLRTSRATAGALRLCRPWNMAHGSQEFALVGYSEDLERRPLKFVEAIPAARICSACGNIPKLTYTLLCGHIFCEPCHESCATSSECVCPLDGDVCVTKDVSRKEYPAENLLRREVHCWNEVHGCGAILPASQIAEHFRRGCQHHVSRCHTCSAAVLSRDVCAHLKCRCTALVLQAPHEAQPRADDSDKTHLMAFEKKIELQVRELDAKLAQLSFESASQSDKLIELCQNNNHLKETLTEQFGQVSERKAAEMKALYCEKSESLMTAITVALASVPSDPKTHQWVMTGYAALKEEALKDGWSLSMTDKVYLRRYLMSWGIRFGNVGDSVNLCLCIQLHEGREDDFVDWPFTKEFKLSIIHPETRQERHFGVKPSSSEASKMLYSRPIGGSNTRVRFGDTRVESRDIERDGYVKSDQLLLRFEVLL